MLSVLLGVIGTLALMFGITLFFTGHEFVGIIVAIIGLILFPSRRNEAQRSRSGNEGHTSYYSNDYDHKKDHDHDSASNTGDSSDSGGSD